MRLVDAAPPRLAAHASFGTAPPRLGDARKFLRADRCLSGRLVPGAGGFGSLEPAEQVCSGASAQAVLGAGALGSGERAGCLGCSPLMRAAGAAAAGCARARRRPPGRAGGHAAEPARHGGGWPPGRGRRAPARAPAPLCRQRHGLLPGRPGAAPRPRRPPGGAGLAAGGRHAPGSGRPHARCAGRAPRARAPDARSPRAGQGPAEPAGAAGVHVPAEPHQEPGRQCAGARAMPARACTAAPGSHARGRALCDAHGVPRMTLTTPSVILP